MSCFLGAVNDLCCFKLICSLMWLLFHRLCCAAACFWCQTWVPCCEGHSEVSEGVTALPTTTMTTAMCVLLDCLNTA